MLKTIARACLLMLPLFLIGCATNPPPASLSSVPCSPPSDLMVPGTGPKPIPHTDLTPKQIIGLWGRDRADLQSETNKRNDLVGFVGEQCK